VNVFGSTLASVACRLVFEKRLHFDWNEIRIITFVGLVSGAPAPARNLSICWLCFRDSIVLSIKKRTAKLYSRHLAINSGNGMQEF